MKCGNGNMSTIIQKSKIHLHNQKQEGLHPPQTLRTKVLITSATDALAFLVGATTVLPALSWFCTYAGAPGVD